MFKSVGKAFTKLFGTKYEKDVKEYTPLVELINEEAERLQSLSNDELRQRTNIFRERIGEYLSAINQEITEAREEAKEELSFARKEDLFDEIDEMVKDRDKQLEEILRELRPEAFAVVKETARRFTNNETIAVTATDHDREMAASKTYVSIEGDQAIWKNRWQAGGNEIVWNMIHYDVQLIGGMVLHDGKIAEMQTGEGKTLVATLPAYLNGLSGNGLHVVTVNDYLAKRDSEWIGPILEFLFLTVDCIDKYRPHSDERVKAYKCDIIYGTNNEFGFDYLRDNMVRSLDEKVQQKHHYAMIDEIDSILIDDARTPLIISGPVAQGNEVEEFKALKPSIERLIQAQRQLVTGYLAEAKKGFKEGNLGHEEGQVGLALLRAHRGLPRYRPLTKFFGETGVKVEMQKAEAFYMQEQSKNMHLADDPLFFHIEEKTNSVELTDKGAEFLAKGGDDPEMFVMPNIAELIMEIDANVTLDADQKVAAKDKMYQDYSIKAQRLHATQQLLKAYALFEKDTEYVVIDSAVKIVDESTGRIMEGRRYSDGLHQALEAKENVKVGDITQTYATVTLQNYFRMYHKLSGMTGTAITEAGEFWEIYKLDVVSIPTNRPIARDDKEDLVFKTQREKFNAVIEEIDRLTGQGRPVLVGTTSVEISELLSRTLNLRKIKHNVLNAKQHQREADIVAQAGHAGHVTIATNMAGRGTDIKLSDEVKASGGLAIIGTERHDSRRVDRQLRGRSGRQGDPGSSQFYVSLEDRLMRLFGSDRIAKMMDKMGHEDGEVIQHSMVSKSIERAQKKVEENNFGMRKNLLEYDDVMNIQREAIYKRRNNALEGERLSVDLNTMFNATAAYLVYVHKSANNYQGFQEDALRIVGISPSFTEEDFLDMKVEDLVETFQTEVHEAYNRKKEQINSVLMPAIQRVVDEEGDRYKRISVPFTDGRAKPLPVAADIKKAIETGGESIMLDIEKTITLSLIDDSWKHHLRSMDELKESVRSASFEQKDPLVIYKKESYHLFEELIGSINEEVVSYLMKGKVTIQQAPMQEARRVRTDMSRISTNKDADARKAAAAAAGQGQRSKPATVRRAEPKVGRNAPCPCGSGKKYKQCHGKK